MKRNQAKRFQFEIENLKFATCNFVQCDCCRINKKKKFYMLSIVSIVKEAIREPSACPQSDINYFFCLLFVRFANGVAFFLFLVLNKFTNH